jgi:hypothetical protein
MIRVWSIDRRLMYSRLMDLESISLSSIHFQSSSLLNLEPELSQRNWQLPVPAQLFQLIQQIASFPNRKGPFSNLSSHSWKEMSTNTSF